MSYILEALKKAELDRAAGKLPDMKTMVLAPRESESSRSMLPYAAALGAVIVLGAGAGWWFSGKSMPKTPREKPPVVSAAAPAPAPEWPAAPVLSGAPPSLSPPARQPDVKSLRAMPETSKTVPHTVPPLAQITKPAPNSKSEKPPAALPQAVAPAAKVAETATPPDKPVAKTQALDLRMSTGLRVLAVGELPADIRKQLPKITAGGYVYSADAASRVVNINERSLREGDELVSGMRLDQIAQDHVVFSFRGYRFRVEMF